VKPVAFAYRRATSATEAIALLDQAQGGAKLIAGGQSLGPMLNLRLARPSLLVDISQINELKHVEERDSSIIIGAAVTHAAIEDGIAPTAGAGLLRAVARTIAYRAVRNRGTIGGSLAHADPAADWLLALTALDASVIIAGKTGHRSLPVDRFTLSAFMPALADDELVVGVEIAKCSPQARWGHAKFCLKVGKFAEASAAIMIDPARSYAKVVLGQPDGAPIELPTIAQHLMRTGQAPGRNVVADAMSAIGDRLDAYGKQLHTANLARAIAQVVAS
jgi:aerobic carbon-monoxide dehydrogenase medium subunit